jgi:uracil-DNA glycosylase
MDKQTELLALAKLRRATRWSGYGCIGDYHGGAYECDFVSPYSKTAGNVDAEIMVMLQDWSSHEAMEKEPFDEETAKLGYTPLLRTNHTLSKLLHETFGITLHDVYGTNLFPFIKQGKMSARIRQADLIKAAREFALPQISIVGPKLVICLGLVTFNALRQSHDLNTRRPLQLAMNSPFNIGRSMVWCQAHTGVLGQNNRNRGGADRVSHDWLKMKAEFGEVAKDHFR